MNEDSSFISLPNGHVARVDADKVGALAEFRYRKSRGEVIRDDETRGTAYLKHDVLGRHDVAVGFVNGDPLDCRVANLKVVRAPETSHQRAFGGVTAKRRHSAPGYHGASKRHSSVVGVTYRKDRANTKPWRARIQVGGQTFYLGHHATREEAEAVARKAYEQAYPKETQ